MPHSIRSPQTDDEWENYYHFRWQQLRKPWRQPRGSEQDEFEHDAFHLMALDKQQKILGVARIHQFDEQTAQIRYMAIGDEYRGQGIGTKLLHQLEQQARHWGVHAIVLNARTLAVDFYRRNGYREIAPGDRLFGEIAHTRMKKSLADNPP